MFTRLISLAIVPVLLTAISCKERDQRAENGQKQGGSVVTTGTAAQNGGTIPTPVVTAANPAVYGNAPVASTFSRYVASVPHAVECIDRFVASGYPEAATIELAVERHTVTRYDKIISVGDYNISQAPVLNIITLDSVSSDVDMRLFNPLGFYCLVRQKSFNSKITVQRNCNAKYLSIFTDDTASRGIFFFGWHKPVSNTTSWGISSQPVELPCVP